MAGGLKKRRKRTLKGTAIVHDVRLQWVLISEPKWSSDGYRGVCISVQVVDQARRELIIEYPFPRGRDGRHPLPQRPPVTPALVQNSIREAFDAGWDPSSRGKAFVYYAPPPPE